MAKGVRRDSLLDASPLDVFAQNLPRARAGRRLPSRVEKERPFAASTFEPGPRLAQIDRDGGQCLSANRHYTLLRAFAQDANDPVLQRHILYLDTNPLGHPKPRPVRELQHGAV